MDKISMREWVAALEGMIDNKLRKWKKGNKIENGESVHLEWQFEQTHMLLAIFWETNFERVDLHCVSPQQCHRHTWQGLTDKTFNKVADRVGNLAQVTMHPPIDPMD